MAPKSVAILKANPHIRQGAGDPDLGIMVAFPSERYKAPTDFVLFGRDKNDNNNEILGLRAHSRPNG
jgi:hypothetical protein